MENWKYAYKTHRALIIAKTSVYFLIFAVSEADFFFKAKHKNLHLFISKCVQTPFDCINIIAHLLEVMLKTWQVYYWYVKM